MFLDNPIFVKEFGNFSKAFRLKVFVGGYLLLLGSTLVSLWPTGGALSAQSDQSKLIFTLFFCINLTLQLLMIPALTATSITLERENNTFATLFSTLLSPFEIMVGKLSASLGMLIFLILLSLPIAALCALTGGIDVAKLIKVTSVLVVTSISYGLVGLACSATSLRSSTAIFKNFILIMLFAGATWVPNQLLGGISFLKDIPMLNVVLKAIESVSPYDALYYLMAPDKYQAFSSSNSFISPYLIFLIASTLIGALSLLIFYRKILDPRLKTAKPAKTKPKKRRKLSWLFYLVDPSKRKKLIRRFSNPVYVAEMRSKIFANPDFIIRSVASIFILSLGLLLLVALQAGTSIDPAAIKVIAVVFQIGVVAILAPGVSSGLISDEIATGTFVLLRMTPLSAFSVIIGKLKATFFYALIFIISSFFVIFAMAYLEKAPTKLFQGDLMAKIMTLDFWESIWEVYSSIAIWIGLLLISTGAFLTSGLFSSSLCKNTKSSTAMAYAIVAFITFITLAPIVMADKLSTSTASFILSINPIAAAIQVMKSGFEDYRVFWPNTFVILLSLTVVFLVISTARVWYLFRKQER